MRRFAALLVLTLAAAAALSPAALGKEGGMEVSSQPVGLQPGEPWTPELRLIGGEDELLAQAKPGMTIRNVETGEELTYAAEPTARPAVWDVRVVFPEGGWWLVEMFDGATGRSYPLGGQWYVEQPAGGLTAPAEPVQPTASPDPGSFPVWPLAAGGTALLLAAAFAAALLRRQRVGLSH